MKIEATFDGNGNMITSTGYSWDGGTSQWVNEWKDENTYDGNGNLIEILGYSWDNGPNQWVSEWKPEYTYDGNGHMILEHILWFDPGTTQWVDDMKTEYTYDANGNPTQEVYSDYDLFNSQWVPNEKYEYTYNLSYGLADLIIPFLDFFMTDYSENIVNMPLGYIDYLYNNNTWEEDNNGTYNYTEISASINVLSIPGIEIYPNPANEILFVDLDKNTNFVKFEILNIKGEEILKQILQEDTEISIGHLSKGVYIIQVSTSNTQFTGKIIKQ